MTKSKKLQLGVGIAILAVIAIVVFATNGNLFKGAMTTETTGTASRGTTAATLGIRKVSVSSAPIINTLMPVLGLRFTAAGETFILNKLTIQQTGGITQAQTQLSLYSGDTNLGSFYTVTGQSGFYVFNNPISIPADGFGKVLTVKANLSAVGDATFSLYINDENATTDFEVRKGATTLITEKINDNNKVLNFTVPNVVSLTDAVFGRDGDTLLISGPQITIAPAGASISVTSNALPANNVLVGTADVTLGKWKLKADNGNVRVSKLCVDLDRNNRITNVASVYSNIRLKVGSRSQNITANDELNGACKTVDLSANADINNGQELEVSVTANLAASIADGSSFQAGLGIADWTDLSTSSNYQTVTAATSGATLTVEQPAQVAVRKLSSSSTVIAGQSYVSLGKWEVKATGGNVLITKACFDLGNSASAPYSAYEILKDGSRITNSTTNVAADHNGTCETLAAFGPYNLNENQTMTIEFRADLNVAYTEVSITPKFGVTEWKDIGHNNYVVQSTVVNSADALVIKPSPVVDVGLSTYMPEPATLPVVIGAFRIHTFEGTAESVSVTAVSVVLDNDRSFPNDTRTDVLTGVTNLRLCKTGTKCTGFGNQYGATITAPTGGETNTSNAFVFFTSPVPIAAGSNVVMDVVVDISRANMQDQKDLMPYLLKDAVRYKGVTSGVNYTAPAAYINGR